MPDSNEVALVKGEIEKHAGSLDSIAASVEQARSAGAHVKMGNEAYGVLCQGLAALISPIQQLGIDVLAESGQSLTATADSLRTAANDFTGADDTSAATFEV